MGIKKRAVSDEQKSHRYDHILDCAFRLFLKTSYDQVSMDKVAAKAKVAKGTLYLYFQSKEELFLALKEREYLAWFDDANRALRQPPGEGPMEIADQVRRCVDILVDSFKEREPMIRLVTTLHHILERNIDFETVVAFNRTIGQRLLQTGEILERAFPFFKKGEGIRFLMQLKALVIGFHHVIEPAEIIEKLVRENDPTLKVYNMSFFEELNRALTHLVYGYLTH